MNKLQLFTGGHPRKVDNLVHLGGAIDTIVDALLKGVAPGGIGLGCRVWGCEYVLSNSNNTIDVEAGVVAIYNGTGYDLLEVDAHQVTKGNTQIFKWQKVTTYLPIDPQLYADLTPRNVHQVNKAVLVGGAAILPATYITNNAEYLCDLITGVNWDVIGINSANWLTNDEPTVDWLVSGATIDAWFGKDNHVRHVNVFVGGSSIVGGDASSLIVKLPENARTSATGAAFIFGQGFCVCYINAGSNLLYIQSIDGGVAQLLTGSIPLIRCSITFEVA